jgi:DMSO/TMAO reductase YedYZ molybdopterin-dependent catalytic subunit
VTAKPDSTFAQRARGAPRRSILAAGGAFAAAACTKLTRSKPVNDALASTQGLTRKLQRFFARPASLAREYGEGDISPWFKPNGWTRPDDPKAWEYNPDYQAHAARNFEDWRLPVDGLVERPLSLSLADLRAMPARTQITRHDCVEGWSCIGKWTGVQLARVLHQAGLKPGVKYVVFHCADAVARNGDGSPLHYYESLDLEDAFHPQTILAYDMNGQALPIPHGAPIRLRVERQLGYKHAKFVMRIEAVDSLKPINGGAGGYWEDNGYEWYAGI